MRSNLYLFRIVLCLIFLSIKGFGQQTTLQLKGQIISDSNDIANVLILNQNTKESTISSESGFFTLDVRMWDVLQFSALHLQTQEIVISDTIFERQF